MVPQLRPTTSPQANKPFWLIACHFPSTTMWVDRMDSRTISLGIRPQKPCAIKPLHDLKSQDLS